MDICSLILCLIGEHIGRHTHTCPCVSAQLPKEGREGGREGGSERERERPQQPSHSPHSDFIDDGIVVVSIGVEDNQLHRRRSDVLACPHIRTHTRTHISNSPHVCLQYFPNKLSLSHTHSVFLVVHVP
jgi:hypothetical protein